MGRERRRRLRFDVVIPPGEGVGHDVVNSSYVLQAEIVLLQVLRPADQPAGQMWLSLKVLKALVVGLDLKRCTDQVVAPMFEGVYEGEQLLLARGVISLCWREFPGVESDWTKKVVVRVCLEQDGSEANRRSVSHDQVLGVGPKGLQNRRRRNCGFQVGESLFLTGSPCKGTVAESKRVSAPARCAKFSMYSL